MAITLRTTTQAGTTNKGSTLTHAELDANFVDLLTNKLSDLTDDTSPQLAGNLDMNGQQIVTTSNGNLKLYPNGSGVVEIGGDGSSNDGTIQLNCSQNSHGIKLASPPHSAGQSYTITFPSTAPGANKIFQTDANGDLSFVDMPSSGGGDNVGAGNNIDISNADSAGEKTISLRSTLNQPVDAGDQQFSNLSIKNYGEIVYTSGTATGTITPDPNNGSVQKITLTGSITLNSLSNVASGDSMTLIVKQPSSGGPYTLSSSMKFAGGTKALSTDANAIDIITIFYDGTDYLASLSTNFS